jgi:hypothetical protein
MKTKKEKPFNPNYKPRFSELEPKKFHEREEHRHMIDLENGERIDPSEFFPKYDYHFDVEYGHDDDYYKLIGRKIVNVPNPNYDKEMKKYLSKREEYEKRLKEWDKNEKKRKDELETVRAEEQREMELQLSRDLKEKYEK